MTSSVIDRVVPFFEDHGLWVVLIATFIGSGLVIASVIPGESVLDAS